MLIDFDITNKIIPNNRPINKFRLAVRVMHGDADKFEIKHQDFNTIEELKKHFVLILAASKPGVNNLDSNKMSKLIKEVSDEYWPDNKNNDYGSNAFEWYDNFIGMDVTSNYEFLATIASAKVTYFNEQSVEFNVDVLIDGKICYINRY